MSRETQKRIADILDAIDKCERYVVALDDDPALAEMAVDAIERNLQIIGEAYAYRVVIDSPFEKPAAITRLGSKP